MTRASVDRANRILKKRHDKKLLKKGLLPVNNMNGSQPGHKIEIFINPQGLVSFATTPNLPIQIGVFACQYVSGELTAAYRDIVKKQIQGGGIIAAQPEDVPPGPMPDLKLPEDRA